MYKTIPLNLSDNLTTLSINYFQPINVHEDSEITLIELQTYNTFPNINKTNNRIAFNLVFTHDNKKKITEYIIQIESGCCEIDELNEAIQREVQRTNDEIREYYKSNNMIEKEYFKFELTTDQI